MEDFPPPPDQDESSLFQHAAAGKDGWPARTGQSMSLREQGNTIDRLSKENFDLKVRVHFLNEELGRRSDEGIKEMTTENAELKTDRQKLQRETQGLRRQVRDLEKLVEHQKSAFKADKQKLHDDSEGLKHRVRDLEHQLETLEPEFKLENQKLQDDSQGLRQKVYELENQLEVQKAVSKLDKQKLQDDGEGLRQKVYGLENQLEAQKAMSKTDKQKLQHDSQELRQIVYDLEHQLEEKRLAELAHAQAGARPVSSEIDAREERGMWRDMLDGETAAREFAEDEARKFRAEIHRLNNGASEGGRGAPERGSGGSSMELDLLKQENSELRKQVSAQSSMIHSRDMEKRRLYTEIDELKLGRQQDGRRSSTGDSILDRSASQIRRRSFSSKTSSGSGRRGSGSDHGDLEARNEELRDQASALKLENHSLREQVDEYAKELQALDRAYQEDVDKANEEMQAMQDGLDKANEEVQAMQDGLDKANVEMQAMQD
ncbi:Anucleate primary sterigmata, partial [Aspergillus sp. HF37]